MIINKNNPKGLSTRGKSLHFDCNIVGSNPTSPVCDSHKTQLIKEDLIMAMGTNNNQNNNGPYEPNYYSRMSIKNPNDKIQLSFSYWKGALKMAIATSPGMMSNTRPEELAYVHLSPIKALILSTYVKELISNPKCSDIKGINTGAGETQGLIVVGRDNECPYIILGKVDKDGNFLQSQRFNFVQQYNYGLNFKDVDKLIFEKEYHNDAELILLQQILDDYHHSANGAMSQAVWDIGRYENNKTTQTLTKMAEKLGVETRGGSANRVGGSAGNSIFNNDTAGRSAINSSSMNTPTGYTTGSIEDLDGEFDE